MTIQPNNLLETLDWHTVQCQCPVHTCSGPATLVVAIHEFDDCNGDDLDPDGNRVELRCEPCVRMLIQQITDDLRGMRHNVRCQLECLTCGAPFTRVEDIVRSVTPL